MDKENKKMIALGRGGGNSGDAVWGSITGTITNQTDLMNQLNLKVGSASDNTFTGNNTFSNDTLIGDWSNIAINLSVGSYGMPVVEGYDENTYKGFNLSTEGFILTDSNLGDDNALGITLDSTTGDVAIASNFGNIDLSATSVNVNGEQIVTSDMLATVATTGDYNDLTNKPTIPAAQVNADWSSNSGVSQILNKPTIPVCNNKLDLSALTQAEMVNFYNNYTTIMDTNTLYWGDYPITGVGTQSVTEQGVTITVVVVEFNKYVLSGRTALRQAENHLLDVDVKLILPDGTIGNYSGSVDILNINSPSATTAGNILVTTSNGPVFNPINTALNRTTETLTFVDANNVSTTVVVYTQPQI